MVVLVYLMMHSNVDWNIWNSSQTFMLLKNAIYNFMWSFESFLVPPPEKNIPFFFAAKNLFRMSLDPSALNWGAAHFITVLTCMPYISANITKEKMVLMNVLTAEKLKKFVNSYRSPLIETSQVCKNSLQSLTKQLIYLSSMYNERGAPC